MNKKYDAVIVGSGPNGLAAAILLQKHGLSVLVLEGKERVGGGMRSEEFTLPGFIHDVCSAVHPLAVASPFFKTLPLEKFGLEFIYPPIAAAHPFEDGNAACLYKSVEETAYNLGRDYDIYKKLMDPLVKKWNDLLKDILAPLHFPSNPFDFASFGINAIMPATSISNKFQTHEAKALWAGMAAHSIQPLANMATSAFAFVLMATGHNVGWPIAKGGSESIAKALSAYFISLGGEIETNLYVRSLNQVPKSRAVLFDLTPKQLLEIAGVQFSSLYKWQLHRFKYGMGVFKIDWALDGPVPFINGECRKAGTIHLGNSIKEIVDSEKNTSLGIYAEKPFVIMVQPSIFDSGRVPIGKHTAWAYCHVPNGSVKDMTSEIENQVERFAPGFKKLILARHVMNSLQLEAYNPNYIGGDINGGMFNFSQLFTRPALRLSPYKTSSKKIYICSSSTPPGGGVHGMCGYFAAKKALKDIFQIIV